MFHQDIYGSGYDHSDSDGIVLRTQLTPIIDKYDFDAVLQGHDHTYSRTYQLSSDGQTHSSYQSAPKTNTDDFSAYLGDNACYNILTNIENKIMSLIRKERYILKLIQQQAVSIIS